MCTKCYNKLQREHSKPGETTSLDHQECSTAEKGKLLISASKTCSFCAFSFHCLLVCFAFCDPFFFSVMLFFINR